MTKGLTKARMSNFDSYVECVEQPKFREKLQALPTDMKQAISQAIGQIIKKRETAATAAAREQLAAVDSLKIQIRDITRELNFAENSKHETQKLYEYYLGFYWGVAGEVDFNELTPDHVAGLNDGLKFINTRPSQIVQHYGDPNPKEKTTNYYHHKDRSN